MNAIEFLNLITKFAKDYRADAIKSIIRNKHMNNIHDANEIKQTEVDAILVDFINFIGMKQCVDYALYTEDIQ